MSGLVAVLGGQEHQPGCEPIDRCLLADGGMTRPTVAVLLAATVPARVGAKMAEACGYWSGLGATVRFGYTGGADETEQALQALSDPDLVILTGGRPWLLHHRITPPIVDRLRRLHDGGVPIAGSSAGAMALSTARLHLQPGQVPRVRPGLGFAPGAVAPHYGRHGTGHACRILTRRHPELTILGLRDRTALVGRGGGAWDVMGAGDCTIVRGGVRQRHPSGATLRLPPRESIPAPAPVQNDVVAAGTCAVV